MMDETEFKAHFDALNEHLLEVMPIVDDFCTRQGFFYLHRKAIGRYPRIRIERPGTPTIWFDLWMELDADGCRYEHFNPKLPYELGAGAYVDVAALADPGRRYVKTFACFRHVPFEEIPGCLMGALEEHLKTLVLWDESYLRKYGMQIDLNPRKE